MIFILLIKLVYIILQCQCTHWHINATQLCGKSVLLRDNENCIDVCGDFIFSENSMKNYIGSDLENIIANYYYENPKNDTHHWVWKNPVNSTIRLLVKIKPFINTSQIMKLNNLIYYSGINWEKMGVVTPIRDQYHCNSDWAIAAIGAVESLIAIKHNYTYVLSVQQLLNMNKIIPFGGCGGGSLEEAFNHIINHNGLCHEKDYSYGPYFLEFEKIICDNTLFSNIPSFVAVPKNNEYALALAILQQPIAVNIQATALSFKTYTDGIYNDTTCYTGFINHRMLIVGFNDEAPIPYYIVKNSWGESWGMNGYIHIARNPTGTGPGICGIATNPVYPSFEPI